MTDPALTELESRIRAEHAEACAAMKKALQHFANAGVAVVQARDQLTQNPWQRWVGGDGGCPVNRHVAMVMVRLSKSDLEAKAQTLIDVMLDRAAEFTALDGGVPQRRRA